MTLIGHSNGASQIVAGLSIVPNSYENRVDSFVSLAVPSYGTYQPILIAQIFWWAEPLYKWFMMDVLKAYSFGPNNYDGQSQSELFWANIYGYLFPTAQFGFFRFFGDSFAGTKMVNSRGMDISSFPVQDIFFQNIANRGFNYYSYGKKGNMKKYGQEKPPPIPLKQMPKDIPILMVLGTSDVQTGVYEQSRLTKNMRNNGLSVEMAQYPLGHMSFCSNRKMLYMKKSVIPFITKHADPNSV